jgi:hypothetical protein
MSAVWMPQRPNFNVWRTDMKITLLLIFSLVLLTGGALAATSANHTVTVVIPTINELTLSGGNITLTFAVPAAGADPADVTDTTCGLSWSTNQASQKITAASSIATPNAALVVVASSASGGTAASAVTLGTTAADFVTGITTGNGSCSVDYTASATSDDTAGSEVHTVTYTITSS